MRRSVLFAALGLAHLAGAGGPSAAQDVGPAIARITVTNLMKGQILTPAVVITHNEETPPLFVPGQPSSPELASLAETGNTIRLTNKFSAATGVLNVARLFAFIRPGKTASLDIQFDAAHRLVSSASMLEMTNDGFVSLLRGEVPCSGVNSYLVGGWDAGSEANTELCSQIPAPCPSPPRRGRCGAFRQEGFVHVHGGIHGCGGFPPEVYDWRHPVARITIEALPDLSPPGTLAAACAEEPATDSGQPDPEEPAGN